jgi:hypothetical protein
MFIKYTKLCILSYTPYSNMLIVTSINEQNRPCPEAQLYGI